MKRTLKITTMAAVLAVFGNLAFADAKGTEIMQKVADFKKPGMTVIARKLDVNITIATRIPM